ncbi:hypothetical protein [Methylobacterium sp. J-068]|uniref:hypothetical protein n=1 Tax=Methylobacterium sp. J-068 TaxID=2836649 RepID=UPI001FBABE9B|nr:hypothetical protein [Methylobacterium sp. J-068]MCJ2035938.1 hypothetical protein [Methylobacterium sp. J-068]
MTGNLRKDIRTDAGVRATRTIRIEGNPIIRHASAVVGRYEKSRSGLQKPETIKSLEVEAGTYGKILDYNDTEILIKFQIGSTRDTASHNTVSLWILASQFGAACEILKEDAD